MVVFGYKTIRGYFVMINKIIHYLWRIFFGLFMLSCILSKIFDIHYLHKCLPLIIPYLIFAFLFADIAIDKKLTVKHFMLFWLFNTISCFIIEWIRLFVVEGTVAFQLVIGVVLDYYDNIPESLYNVATYNFLIIVVVSFVGMMAYLPFSKNKIKKQL